MGLTVVVVLVVLAVIAAVAFVALQGRRRRQEQQRVEAAEHRHEAEIRSASAQRREAEAAERAARAEHEQAQAQEQAARARQDREVAEARHAAADRIDPDRRGQGGDTSDGHPDDGPRSESADPAARTDELHLAGTDGQQPGPGGHHAPTGEGRHHAEPSEPGPGQPPQRPHMTPDRGSTPAAAAMAPHGEGPSRHGPGADPAARTDDLRLGSENQAGHDQTGGGETLRHAGAAAETDHARPAAPVAEPNRGWHGPTASGGYAAEQGAAPADARHGSTGQGDDVPGGGAPDAPADRAADQPAMPTQRSGEHDKEEHDRGEPAGERHGVRALADRLLRRDS